MAADIEQLRRDGHRVEKWSIGWMVLSLVMWGWFGYRLLRDNDQEFGRHTDDGHTLVGILALAVIPTIIAAATAVYSRVMFRLARQAKRS
jgi:heme/copper-type cytochrome/quinol oxidase subunit 2